FGQPFLQVEIVGNPAKQSHRHVCVAVDETGNNNFAGSVYDFARRVVALDFGRLADRSDATALNRHAAIVNDAAGAIHGDDSTAFDDQVGGSFPSLGINLIKGSGKNKHEQEDSCSGFRLPHYSRQNLMAFAALQPHSAVRLCLIVASLLRFGEAGPRVTTLPRPSKISHQTPSAKDPGYQLPRAGRADLPE